MAHSASVFFDGESISTHEGGYTPFETVLADVAAGDHEIVVRVDNALDKGTIPRAGSDWFPYGGITREVVLEAVPDVFVDDLRIEYSLAGEHATVEAAIDVRNLGEETQERVGIELDGTTDIRPVEFPRGTTTVTRSLELASVDRWSPDDPRLSLATARAGDDELRDRIGFRTVEVDGTNLLLNG